MQTHRTQLVAIGSKAFSTLPCAVVEIFPESTRLHSNRGLPNNITGIWGWKGLVWYISGDGVYQTRNLDGRWQQLPAVSRIFTYSVRGSGPNDVFVAGDFGFLAHWNGREWHTYTAFSSDISWYRLAVREDMVVVVGQRVHGILVGGGVIAIGKR